MINPMQLTGKQVLVAGAASETGEAIVSQLILLGARVLMVDHDEAALVHIQKRIDSDMAVVYAFDLYTVSHIEDHFKQITSTYGVFHGFVFCAGMGGVRPLSLTKHAFVHEMMQTNVYVFIEMARCLSKKNAFVTGGSMVAISSVSSIKGLKSKTAYSASKAALDAAVRCMAAELSDKKIRVNSILKGWVSSDMKKDFIKNNIALSEDDDFKRQLLGVIEPVELANTVAFLLSDATRSITGTSLLLDGGYTL